MLLRDSLKLNLDNSERPNVGSLIHRIDILINAA